MRRILVLLVFIFKLVGIVEAQGIAQGSRQWDFEADVVGKPAAGFRTAVGTWTVAQDGDNRVLAQTAQSGTAPHAEMGGYGTGPNDRGIRFYYEWVRDNVGRWEYPRHVPSAEFSVDDPK